MSFMALRFNSSRITALMAAQRRLPVRTVRSTVRTYRTSTSTVPTSLVTATAVAVVAASVALCVPHVTLLEAPAPTTKEAATGIVFPTLVNGHALVGTGVRVKYGLIKVYAVGTYMDVSALPNDTDIDQALLDPTVPRTIRIVLHRNLSIEKYTDAIVEALTPRMHGQDLDKLDEFKALNPPIDLVSGAVMEMTIRNGDTLLYKNAVGGYGSIQSAAFCRALLDTYYGADPVSPTHKASVVQGVKHGINV